MAIEIFKSPKEIPRNVPVTYYHKNYFSNQQYTNFIAFSDSDQFIAFDIVDKVAISIPRSPFGSFYRLNGALESQTFIANVQDELKKQGVTNQLIHHPSNIYSSFCGKEELQNAGYEEEYVDVNQHIALEIGWEDSIHQMQKRKLNSLQEDGFVFREMKPNELETAHKFLTVCRQAQGLQINISWEQLHKLATANPDAYSCFGVFRENKISALCISVQVNQEVAYYYLPGTSPMFRNQSPMVMLIAGMVDHYREKSFKFLDLGVSSSIGQPQETLMLFKERMGAVKTGKPTFSKSL